LVLGAFVKQLTVYSTPPDLCCLSSSHHGSPRILVGESSKLKSNPWPATPCVQRSQPPRFSALRLRICSRNRRIHGRAPYQQRPLLLSVVITTSRSNAQLWLSCSPLLFRLMYAPRCAEFSVRWPQPAWHQPPALCTYCGYLPRPPARLTQRHQLARRTLGASRPALPLHAYRRLRFSPQRRKMNQLQQFRTRTLHPQAEAEVGLPESPRTTLHVASAPVAPLTRHRQQYFTAFRFCGFLHHHHQWK
jgi:hypothetical protein